jgi:uncharacterized protein
VTVGTAALLLVAGVAGGLSGSIAGLASLFSYPALLAAGLPATAANVTNTVSLAVGGVGAVAGSRPELAGQGATARRLGAVCVLGGAAGAGLLLVTPPGVFEKVVPVLVGGASLALLARRRVRAADPVGPRPGPAASRAGRAALVGGSFLTALYGGYFGAAAGVVMLALLHAALREPLPRVNALKNLLLGLANAVAAIGFAVFGPVSWSAALPMTVGLLAGSWAGPSVVRRVPAGPLRVAIALAGLALAVRLAVDAW